MKIRQFVHLNTFIYRTKFFNMGHQDIDLNGCL